MYDQYLETRNRKVDGIAPWVCVKEDNTWRIIAHDWETGTKEKIKKYCRSFGIAIQAGGHQGLYPRLLSEFFQRVITFEPNPLNFHCLVRNCQKDNITCLQMALGDECTLVDACYPSNNLGMTKLGYHGDFDGIINNIIQFRLDNFFVGKVDLLFLDTEGSELGILYGSLKLIEQCKPMVILENGMDEDKVLFMQKLGYELVANHSLDGFFLYGGYRKSRSN